MQNSTADISASVLEKVRELARQRDRALTEADELRRDNDNLRRDIEELRKELHAARLDVEFLTVSHRLADNPQALADARRLMASLIRKVDAAISLVRTDPADL
ncbi:MAG: hypothetical protein HDR80_06160 [Bacteroides sp.]|nr:hypothetical protein [Bacteroides sp.]